VINKRLLSKNHKEIEYVRSERFIMADLRHPFLVSLSYAFQSEKKLYYVMEYVPGGELFTRLLEEGVLPINHVQVLLNDRFDRNPTK
jgi:serine/threonine protein kinase